MCSWIDLTVQATAQKLKTNCSCILGEFSGQVLESITQSYGSVPRVNDCDRREVVDEGRPVGIAAPFQVKLNDPEPCQKAPAPILRGIGTGIGAVDLRQGCADHGCELT
ncbi:MAG: hypothetical protein EOP32_12570 [Rhodococcus sp. (in: high G+C Gram-positive bacteria)]|nr:MAG: hypothetical protein EOP32_12570 [Rhodococcus sp. (in: high G+C Gram-positive bacteria)]